MSYTWTEQTNSGSRSWTSVASSSDGTKLVACVIGGFIYTSSDSGVTWTQRDSSRSWKGVASSSDGTKLVACVNNGFIYTSSDSGVTWTQRDSSRFWQGVASSSDGTKLVACVSLFLNYIYTSSDSGVTWTPQTNSFTRSWTSVASSSDGTKLVACVNNGFIYTSSDSGVTWTQRDSSRSWQGVASSSDGTKLVACVASGFIYTSSDSGVTWTQRDSSRFWQGVASSSDGTKLVACVNNAYIYTSSDSGVTWTQQTSAGSRSWNSVASSSDGAKLVACVSSGYIYTGGPPPTNVTATTSGYGDATITWTAPSAGTVTNYVVTSTPLTSSVTTTSTSTVVTGLKNYQNYIFTVTANFSDGSTTFASSSQVTSNYPCFLIGSKILTDKGYKLIENLRKGDLVKTLKNDYLPIVLIGKSIIYNSGNSDRIKNRLYNLPREKYQDLIENLVLTGCHSILVDTLTQEQEKATVANYSWCYVTDNKYRLESYLDDKAEPYPVEGTFTIYHLALENENYFSNYGIWANGLLVESCSKRYLTELSSMEFIE